MTAYLTKIFSVFVIILQKDIYNNNDVSNRFIYMYSTMIV